MVKGTGITIRGGNLNLEFIPDSHEEDFVAHVIEYYEEVGMQNESGEYPCVESQLSTSLTESYFWGCLYSDSGNKNEFSEQLNKATEEEMFDVWWDTLWHEFVETPDYFGYREEFYHDIQIVLNAHNMSYSTVYVNPFNSMDRTYYGFNSAVIEVW